MNKFLVCLWVSVLILLSVPSTPILAEANTVQVWHLFHSGYAVKVKNVFLIFDYLSFMHSGESLDEGYVYPEEIQNYKVVVLISHEDGDHYDPNLFNWIEDIPDITFILGWENQQNDHCICMKPREILKIGPLEIMTIESLDGGVGFLVKIDHIRIFHAGDYSLRDKSKEEHFKGELTYLQERVHSFDIMMMAIDYGSRPYVNEGTIKAISMLQPTYFFPMHCYYKLKDYQRFADENKVLFPRTTILAPERFGSSFECDIGLVDCCPEYLDFGQVDREELPLPIKELIIENQGDYENRLLIQEIPNFIETITSPIIIPAKTKISLVIHLIPDHVEENQQLSGFLVFWAEKKTFKLFTTVFSSKIMKNPVIQVDREIIIPPSAQKGELFIFNTGNSMLTMSIHAGKDLKTLPSDHLQVEAGTNKALSIEIAKKLPFVIWKPLITLKQKKSYITLETNDSNNRTIKIKVIYWNK